MKVKEANILFVDDDQNILQGLKRSLYHMRDLWHIDVFSDPNLALENLKSNSYDIIVSDARMPIMNGADFLEKVRHISPGSVRFMLTGQVEEKMTADIYRVAHRCIYKPCSPGQLIEHLNSALKTRKMLLNSTVQLFENGIIALPVLPQNHHELVSALQSNEISVKDIVEIIIKDVGLTSKIMQLANSSYFGSQREVVEPIEAVTILGTHTILGLAITHNIFSNIQNQQLIQDNLSLLNKRALTAARVSTLLCQHFKLNRNIYSSVFLATLLHTVGEAVILGFTVGKGEKYLQARTFDFEAAGAYLLSIWGLPEFVCQMVLHHKDLGDIKSMGIGLLIVHLAVYLVSQYNKISFALSTETLDEFKVQVNIAEWQEKIMKIEEK